jgi:NTE family protein
LTRLVDFEHLSSAEAMRLTVSAVQVTSGALAYFDSKTQALDLKHVMASGALPPGFPPVRIDGQLYWDGGLFSNTPLEIVLDEEPRANRLCFMVDLWSATGPEPQTLDQVQTRQKDVMYASRSKSHIDDYMRIHNLRRNVRALYDALPPEARNAAAVREMSAVGCDTTVHIVRLPYAGRDWNMASKDINFSRGSIEWRWDQGYGDATRAVEQAAWLNPVAPNVGVVVHNVTPILASKSAPKSAPGPAPAPGARKSTAHSAT